MGEPIPVLKPHENLAPPGARQPEADETSRRLYAELLPALVKLETNRGTGSGFFVNKEGHVATSAHVVLDTSEIYATTSEGKTYRARIERLSDTADLAELKLEDFDGKIKKHFEVGKVQKLTTNQPIFALGFPQGYRTPYISPGTHVTNVLTFELVDKTAMAFQYAKATPEEKDDWLKALSRQLVQNDMHIEPGSSGGPLVDAEGNLVGIAEFVNRTDRSISYYAPVEELRKLITEEDRKFEFFNCDQGSAWEKGFNSLWLGPSRTSSPTCIMRRDGTSRPAFNWKNVNFK